MDARAAPAHSRPDLIVRKDDLPATARALAGHIGEFGQVFNRGTPVRVVSEPGGRPRVQRLSTDAIVNLAHDLTRLIEQSGDGHRKPVTLPDRVAKLYLALEDWGLLPLNGITTAPLLSADGCIRSQQGYDHQTALWCANVPPLSIPDEPSQSDALAALHCIREAVRTFPFADAQTVQSDRLRLVDTRVPAGLDESGLILALMTAVCRSSLPLAPGLLISAPNISGAGTGKGLLIRALSAIAYGQSPYAFTVGREAAELEKRIGAVLLDAEQVIFIDNVNGQALKNDLLASVMSESHVQLRPLGTSDSVRIASRAFVALTGNGLGVSEDLARRFVVVELDAGVEDPEQRPFPPGYLDSITARRDGLLAAVLTIWRWGRQNESTLAGGRSLGGFEQWCRWVRDPLLALGCADPIDRLRVIKAHDPERRAVADLFDAWWQHHAERPMKVADLAEPVRELLDPQGRGRQFQASRLSTLVGTRSNRFVLTCQRPTGKWGKTTYALRWQVPE